MSSARWLVRRSSGGLPTVCTGARMPHRHQDTSRTAARMIRPGITFLAGRRLPQLPRRIDSPSPRASPLFIFSRAINLVFMPIWNSPSVSSQLLHLHSQPLVTTSTWQSTPSSHTCTRPQAPRGPTWRMSPSTRTTIRDDIPHHVDSDMYWNHHRLMLNEVAWSARRQRSPKSTTASRAARPSR